MLTERVIFIVSRGFWPGWAEVGSFASLSTAEANERQRIGKGEALASAGRQLKMVIFFQGTGC